MAKFEEYASKCHTMRMERRNGILQVTFHTNGGPLDWDANAKQQYPEWVEAFSDIGSDPENKVVIITGTGDVFSGPSAVGKSRQSRPAGEWDRVYWDGKHLLSNLLDIEVPMISAVNGPALRHAEIPLLCDIVLAAEGATFQDTSHMARHGVPGDGMHVVLPHLMGLNRGRYFLLTSQTLSAKQAQEYGLVGEVLPKQRLLPRAWELAEKLAQRPPLVLRYTRVLLTQHLKGLMHDLLGYGLALEGLADMDKEGRIASGK